MNGGGDGGDITERITGRETGITVIMTMKRIDTMDARERGERMDIAAIKRGDDVARARVTMRWRVSTKRIRNARRTTRKTDGEGSIEMVPTAKTARGGHDEGIILTAVVAVAVDSV